MPNLAWTYTTLLAALQDWPVHTSVKYVQNLPNIIAAGERRLWGDLNVEEYDVPDDSQVTVIGTRTIPKPADVKQVRTVGLIVAGKYVDLELRSAEYCRMFAPDPTVQAAPQFYAELSYNQIYVVPTPNAVYPVSYRYVGDMPESLSAASPNTTTWLARAGADALLTACLAEAEQYIKADDRYDDYMKKYNNELVPRLRAELRKSIRSGDYSPMKPAAGPAQ